MFDMFNMGGSQKSKRISWASDVNLCQVRLFLSEESPSQVGNGTQEHLQPKVTRSGSFAGNGPDDNLPPGFEGSQPVNQWNAKLSQIPVIKWKCPPRFKVNTSWQVVAGDESKETDAETLRQAKMLEAIYPRVSAIPPNPSEPSVAETVDYNDQNTLVVPLMPVEDEEDPALDASSLGSSSAKTASSPLSALDPNILSNLQAAFSPYTSSPNQGNSIDQDLLMKILSNPNLVEELMKKQGGSSSSSQNTPIGGTQTILSQQSSAVHSTPPLSTHNVASSSLQGMATTHNLPSNLRSQAPSSFDQGRAALSWAPANLPFNPQVRVGLTSMTSVRPPHVPEASAMASKDINYYKSLIQQHGGERRESSSITPYPRQFQNAPFGTNQEFNNNAIRPRESKPRIMRPCMYFNTPRGCRNGANCSFLHDNSSQAQQRIGGGGAEVPNAKRMKMDRELGHKGNAF